jgi:hypothetical protein
MDGVSATNVRYCAVRGAGACVWRDHVQCVATAVTSKPQQARRRQRSELTVV